MLAMLTICETSFFSFTATFAGRASSTMLFAYAASFFVRTFAIVI
jgi:hypothetical protein